MKISFYKPELGWHGRAELRHVESVCIEFGGKKVYVFNNTESHTVGVNIFDFSKGQDKILSYNEPHRPEGVGSLDDDERRAFRAYAEDIGTIGLPSVRANDQKPTPLSPEQQLENIRKLFSDLGIKTYCESPEEFARRFNLGKQAISKEHTEALAERERNNARRG